MIASKDVSAGSPLPRGVRRVLDAMRGNVGRNWRLAELADPGVDGVFGDKAAGRFQISHDLPRRSGVGR